MHPRTLVTHLLYITDTPIVFPYPANSRCKKMKKHREDKEMNNQSCTQYFYFQKATAQSYNCLLKTSIKVCDCKLGPIAIKDTCPGGRYRSCSTCPQVISFCPGQKDNPKCQWSLTLPYYELDPNLNPVFLLYPCSYFLCGLSVLLMKL